MLLEAVEATYFWDHDTLYMSTAGDGAPELDWQEPKPGVLLGRDKEGRAVTARVLMMIEKGVPEPILREFFDIDSVTLLSMIDKATGPMPHYCCDDMSRWGEYLGADVGWVHRDDMGGYDRINFCPFCGVKKR